MEGKITKDDGQVMMTLAVGGKLIHLCPGDILDLGPDGVIEWLDGDEAKANRLERGARAKRVRDAIEFASRR